MHRIDASGHSSNLFTDGNPSGGIEATVVDDDWLNAVQEEIVNAILTRAGITLVKGTNTQLATALDQFTLLPGGRLTLTTAVPVTTADVSGATTVYYTPHRHNRIALYDGTRWLWRTFSEMSQLTTDNTKSPAAVANNSNYDVFVWLDGSTMRATRGPAWTGDTARGAGAGTSELEFFEGRWVNKVAITNGPAARCGLYVGTIRSDGSAQINDTAAKRHVWNTYNRALRPMNVVDTTDSWNYTLAAFQQANANAANQLDYVVGLAEEAVTARVLVTATNGGSVRVTAGIGIDSAVANSAQIYGGGAGGTPSVSLAHYAGQPGIGRHYLAWLEWSTASGTTTWYGDNAATGTQAGISGEVWG